MINPRIFTVIKSGLKAYFSSKAFLWSTLLLPVLMFGIIIVQTSLMNMESKEPSAISILSDDPRLLGMLEAALKNMEQVKSGLYTLTFSTVADEGIISFVEQARAKLLADSNNGIFFIPSSAGTDKKISFYSNNPGNQDVRKNLAGVINMVLNQKYFSDKPVAQVDINYAVLDVDIAGVKVTTQGIGEQRWGNHIAGFTMAVLLMLSMFMIAMPFAGFVLEEKMNRAVEVMLTSLSPRELLAGKIITSTIAGLTQMLVWLMPVFILMLDTSVLSIPEKYQVDLGLGTIAFFLTNYVLGLTIILSLWGGLSAMFDSAQDAGAALFPITLLMWVPFYAIFSLLKNPANSVAEVLSILPFTSMYVMPLRMAIIDVPAWQPLLALGLSAVLLYGAVVCGGKIYRISILATGQKPSLKKFMYWVRYA